MSLSNVQIRITWENDDDVNNFALKVTKANTGIVAFENNQLPIQPMEVKPDVLNSNTNYW